MGWDCECSRRSWVEGVGVDVEDGLVSDLVAGLANVLKEWFGMLRPGDDAAKGVISVYCC